MEILRTLATIGGTLAAVWLGSWLSTSRERRNEHIKRLEEALASFQAETKVIKAYWLSCGMVLGGEADLGYITDERAGVQGHRATSLTPVQVLVAVHLPKLDILMDQFATITATGNTAIVSYLRAGKEGGDEVALKRLTEAFERLVALERRFGDAVREEAALLRPKPYQERLRLPGLLGGKPNG